MKSKNIYLTIAVLFLISFLYLTPKAFARSFPLTLDKIHIFNDQLSGDMSLEQTYFAAKHYDGTQKMTRSMARRLRRYNHNFMVLHYRLGVGLGYQSGGEWINIINRDSWVREWPDTTEPQWFYQYSGSDVFNNAWGWYLMDIGNNSWRTYWTAQVKRQMANNENDGLFADSYNIPNYMGGGSFTPNLPDFDEAFESEWSTKINNFSDYVTRSFGGNYYFIPNAGMWVTSRDTTDYRKANGIMIEGFGAWDAYSNFELSDWQLQMNRILSIENLNKAVIAQSYIDSPSQMRARMFFLSNYLLIKDRHTYINLEMGYEPEWFPEYGIKIGWPLALAPSNISSLYISSRVYRRLYSNGWVLLNPTSVTRTVRLGRTLYQVVPSGGGYVGTTGRTGGKISYRRVSSVTLGPYSGMVLLKSRS